MFRDLELLPVGILPAFVDSPSPEHMRPPLGEHMRSLDPMRTVIRDERTLKEIVRVRIRVEVSNQIVESPDVEKDVRVDTDDELPRRDVE